MYLHPIIFSKKNERDQLRFKEQLIKLEIMIVKKVLIRYPNFLYLILAVYKRND